MARVPEPAVRLRLQQVEERFLAAAVADDHEEGAAVRAVGFGRAVGVDRQVERDEPRQAHLWQERSVA